MKFAILLVALASVLPLSGWLRANPQHKSKIWTLFGFLPFVIPAVPHLNIAIISWADWPGFVKGAEISALDLFALAIYISLPRSQNTLPFRLSMGLYFFAVLLSASQASVPFAAFLYVWQLARVFLIYAVVTRGCADTKVVMAVLTGMVIGLGGEALMVIIQRFGFGEIQASGTFVHQNTLGLASHFVVFPFFSLLLTSQTGWQCYVAPIAGCIVAALTGSRATIGLAAVGYFSLFAFSALRRWTMRKLRIAAAGLVVFIVLAPLSIETLEKRFSTEPTIEYDERAAFESAANMMLSDFPLGVGANNYIIVANAQGYLQRAGVAPTSRSRGANVHNAYLLSFAETGYIGGLTFMLMFFQPMLVAFRVGWRHRRDPKWDLLLGFGMSLLIVAVHNAFEWIFVTYYIQYIFAISVGAIAGLAQQLGYRSRQKFNHGPTNIGAQTQTQ